ncbi:MAG: ABC transporter permease subunit [Alphaproteobacteria bacterium]
MTAAADTGAGAAPGPARRVDPALIAWIVAAVIAVVCFSLRDEVGWLKAYPKAWVIPFDVWMNVAMAWFVDSFKWLFRGMSWLLDWPMTWLRGLLHWLPWPATIVVFSAMAHAAAGWRLAAFTVVSLLYMVVVGYWDESMNTLALVGVSVPLAVGAGFLIGIWGFKSRAARRIIEPTLDVMQTVPTFAYLIPILLLFGFGTVVGLVASVIYAVPPMVRNTMLGLTMVPAEIVESGRMSGCTERQLMWWVQVPAATHNIMMGVNQTIMAALSMVIIAAVIGGFADIGWEVLSTMRKAQTGQSLLAGIVIALMAMIMDRISRGFTERSGEARVRSAGYGFREHPDLYLALGAAVAFIALAYYADPLRAYPEDWIVYPAQPINDAVTYVTKNYYGFTNALKNGTLFYLMLPLKVGFETIVRPRYWGFGLTPGVIAAYVAIVVALAFLAWRASSWRAVVGVAIGGGLYYFGTVGTPWPVFILAVTLLAWQVGSWRLALFAFLGLGFILVTGAWPRAMLTIYLAAAAVFISFTLGGALGIWAAHNDRVSALIRPINDTLQTMPLFVFLIPVIMIFLIGDFSALLAIVLYAVVPAIRYTESGLRQVDPEVIEAAESMGCTRPQILWQVKMPLALPEIMLGLNQTIMFGLAMLVIAALVGTQGLGQLVYEGVTKANFGWGVISGGGIALIAMITDRIIQAWSARKKQELGLA